MLRQPQALYRRVIGTGDQYELNPAIGYSSLPGVKERQYLGNPNEYELSLLRRDRVVGRGISQYAPLSPGRISREIGIINPNFQQEGMESHPGYGLSRGGTYGTAVFPAIAVGNIHGSSGASEQRQLGLARGLYDASSTFRSKLQAEIGAATQAAMALPVGSPRREALEHKVNQLYSRLNQGRSDQVRLLAQEPYMSQSFRGLDFAGRITGYTSPEDPTNKELQARTGSQALKLQTGQAPENAEAVFTSMRGQLNQLPGNYGQLNTPEQRSNFHEAVKAKALLTSPTEELVNLGYRLKPAVEQTVLDMQEGPMNYMVQKDAQGNNHFIALDRLVNPKTGAAYEQTPTHLIDRDGNIVRAGYTLNELYSELTDPISGDIELRQPIQNTNYGGRAGYLSSSNFQRSDSNYTDRDLLQQNTFGARQGLNVQRGIDLDPGIQYRFEGDPSDLLWRSHEDSVIDYLQGVGGNAVQSNINVVPEYSIYQSLLNRDTRDFARSRGLPVDYRGNLIESQANNYLLSPQLNALGEEAIQRIQNQGIEQYPDTLQERRAIGRAEGIPLLSVATTDPFKVAKRSSYRQALADKYGWDGPYSPEFEEIPASTFSSYPWVQTEPLGDYRINKADRLFPTKDLTLTDLYSTGVLSGTAARREFSPEENRLLRLGEYMSSPEYQVGTGQIEQIPLGNQSHIIQSSNMFGDLTDSVAMNEALYRNQVKANEYDRSRIQGLNDITKQRIPGDNEIIDAGTLAHRLQSYQGGIDEGGTVTNLYQQVWSDPSLVAQSPSRIGRDFAGESLVQANPNAFESNFQTIFPRGEINSTTVNSAKEAQALLNDTQQQTQRYVVGQASNLSPTQAGTYTNLQHDPAQYNLVQQQIAQNRALNRGRPARDINAAHWQEVVTNPEVVLPSRDPELSGMRRESYGAELALSNALDRMIMDMEHSRQNTQQANLLFENAGMPTNYNSMPSRPGLSQATQETLAQMRDKAQSDYAQKVNEAQSQITPDKIAALKKKAEARQAALNRQQVAQQQQRQQRQQGQRNKYGARQIDPNSPAAQRLRARFNR